MYNFVLYDLIEGITKEHDTSDNSETENTISFSTSHEDIYGTHKRTRYALKVTNFRLTNILLIFFCKFIYTFYFRELNHLKLI